MSKYEQRDNSGSLFKNEGDRKRENGPDYSGTAKIDGQEFFMDAWIKRSDNGRAWMSFSFKPKEKQAPKANQAQRGRADDDIPF